MPRNRSYKIKDLADAVTCLLASPSRRLELGAAARQRVERSYSFPALQAACREALSNVFQAVEAERG